MHRLGVVADDDDDDDDNNNKTQAGQFAKIGNYSTSGPGKVYMYG